MTKPKTRKVKGCTLMKVYNPKLKKHKEFTLYVPKKEGEKMSAIMTDVEIIYKV